MQNKPALLLFVVVGLVGACSGKSTEHQAAGAAGSASVGNATPLSDFPSVYASGACGLFDRCWKTLYQTLNESCESYFDRLFREQDFSNIQAAIKAGTIEYHPEALPACLKEFEQTNCEASEFPDCLAVFVGTKKTGDDCNLNQECASDSQCVPGATCPGKCAKLVSAGGVCNADKQCAHELKCVEAVTGDGTCVVPVGAGKACNEMMPCAGLLDCLGDVPGDATSMGSCQSRDALYSGSENDVCSLGGNGRLCKPGLTCVFDETTSSAGTCQPLFGPDAACQLGYPEPCSAGQYCKITSPSGVTPLTGQCTKTPGVGEACNQAGISLTVCEAGQFCTSDSQVCAITKHLGEACSSGRECLSSHCGTNGTCVYPLDCEPSP